MHGQDSEQPDGGGMKAETKMKSLQLGVACQSAYPKVFNHKRPVPLAVGIHEQIMEAFPTVGHQVVHRFLSFWTSRLLYLRIMAEPEAVRTNLDGTAAGLVGESHREYAVRKWKEASERKAVREQKAGGVK